MFTPKPPFAIIFSSGCGGTTEIIIFLPPQLRKADGKQKKILLFSLVPTTKPNFFVTEAAAAGAIFPSPEKREGRNLTGVAVTLKTLYTKANENGFRCATAACFLRDGKMGGAAMSLALERSFANTTATRFAVSKQGPAICAVERHKTQPGQAVAFWDVLTTKTKETIQKQAQE